MGPRRARLRMALRFVQASLGHGRRRVAAACLAVALGVSLPATVVGLRGVEDRLEQELQAHGANLLIVPRHGSALDAGTLAVLDRMAADGLLDAYAPVLGLAARIGGRQVAVVGTRFAEAKALHRAWDVEGSWPEETSAALMGANVAAKLGHRPGDGITIETESGAMSLRVAGVLRTGGTEENQVFLDLDAAGRLAGRPGLVSLVQGRARRSRELPAVTAALTRALPAAEVRTPYQVAKAEALMLGRVERLLLLVAGVVLAASVLGVFASMAAHVLERRRDVGVMKALGAEETTVLRLFCAEALAIGLAGGLSGFGLGLLLGEAIAWRVFGAFVAPSVSALAVSLAVGLGVTFGASLGPIRRAARGTPVTVLRGE